MSTLLLLHLSDLHIHCADDAILSRTEQIASAAQWGMPAVACVVLVTGDVTYSGTVKQYEAAAVFFQKLREQLAQRLSVSKVDIVIVPGNHDVSHPEDCSARDVILESIVKGRKMDVPALSVTQICTAPQSNFFHEGRKMGDPSIPESPCLFWTQSISAGGHSIGIICLNSAWMSKKSERQGDLLFPPSLLPYADDVDLTIALMHHPNAWYQSECGRELERRLSEVADLILAGHEHDGDHTVTLNSKFQNVIIDGDALQSHGSRGGSVFSVMRIGIAEKWHSWRRLTWKRDRYETLDENAVEGPLPVAHRRVTRATQISHAWERELSDPGVFLENSRGALRLDDLYVEPYIVPVDPLSAKQGHQLASTLLHCDREFPVMVVGEERAGRSSLGKFLCRKALAMGAAPLLVKCDASLQKSSKPSGWLAEIFTSLYHGESTETYIQLSAERRIVILDNFERVPAQAQQSLIEYLRSVGALTIALCDDTLGWELLSAGRGAVQSVIYRILPFRRSQREELITRWQNADGLDVNALETVKERDGVLRTFDTILGHSFLPASPFYLVSILNSMDGQRASMRESANGYYYELLIRTHLMRASGAVRSQFNVTLTYLSELAWSMFIEGRDWLVHADWMVFHRDYISRYAIHRDFQEMMKHLIERNVIVQRQDEFRFRYPYMYYYFVALHLRDHLTEKAVQDAIRLLCQDLSKRQNANILIFLTHLTKDEVVIDTIMGAARCCYADSPEAKMEGDSLFLHELGLSFGSIEVDDLDAVSSRSNRLRVYDQHESGFARDVDSFDSTPADWANESGQEIAAFQRSIHTIDILGQILKNFPGSLNAERKLAVVSAAYSLAMRFLGEMFGAISAHREDFLTMICGLLQGRYPSWSAERVSGMAAKTLAALATIGTYGMIRRLAAAVGSQELLITYDALTRREDSNAAKVLRLALDLEQQKVFPSRMISELNRRLQGNPLPQWVLRDLVIDHFHMFPIDRAARQKTSAELGIQWRQIQLVAGDVAGPSSGSDVLRRGKTEREQKKMRRRRKSRAARKSNRKR